MSFWKDAKKKLQEEKPKEEVVDLQAKLSKLELSDINYIHDLMIERTYRGRELEQATTTYLKVKFIKTMLEGGINVEEETEDS
jgi:hypothetical protein|tara:strand:+ start:2264 stop:2512 length:249 start_codon:yes stop_codon:yes gene_type:complete